MHRSVALLAVLTTLVASACSTGAAPSPVGVRCAAGDPAAATRYPGWPGAGTGSASSQGFIPIIASQELSVGPNRVLMTLIDDANEPIASDDLEVELRFFQLAGDPGTPTQTVDAPFLPVEAGQGFYRANVEFTCAGDWGVEVVGRQAGTDERSARVIFSVREESSTPGIGEPAPASETPTARDPEGIAVISTDDDPDPDFYRTSVDEALAAKRPFVVSFATPAFCRTRTCGPALDIVKEAAAEYKDRLTFIHVEPYELEQRDGQLQPVLDANGQLVPVGSVTEWGIVTEPITFVVDADGRVAAKFEALAGADELADAFEAVAEG